MISLKEGKELSPGIVVYENVIESPQKFIDIGLSSGTWTNPKVNSSSGGEVNKSVRDCEMIDLTTSFTNPKEWFELAQTIWLYTNKYSQEYNAPFSSMEILQMLRYYPVTNFYKSHADSGPGYPRIISAILYLNDVRQGGETYFNRFDVTVKPKAGNLLLFPSEFIFTHEGRPPISNEKFVVVTWFHPILPEDMVDNT
jgi:hypothetical protein